EVLTEGLDARRMAQVEAEDLEPILPLLEIRFGGVARGRVTGKPGRDDQVRARPQQLQAGLIADLHAAAGQQCDAPAQIGELRPLAEIEPGALGTELVVKVVNLAVLLLADIAVTLLSRFAAKRRCAAECLVAVSHGRRTGVDVGRWKVVRRREDRLAPQLPDARLVQDPVVTPDDLG